MCRDHKLGGPDSLGWFTAMSQKASRPGCIITQATTSGLLSTRLRHSCRNRFLSSSEGWPTSFSLLWVPWRGRNLHLIPLSVLKYLLLSWSVKEGIEDWRRYQQICYFYKNIIFGFSLFLYEMNTSFSRQPAYNDWFLSLYNVFFSSLPVVALGVFDQDLSPEMCLKYPLLYQEEFQNGLFGWIRILSWMFNRFSSAIIIYFLSTKALEPQAFKSQGHAVCCTVLLEICLLWSLYTN